MVIWIAAIEPKNTRLRLYEILLVTYFDQATYDISIAPFISVHEIFPGHHLNLKSRDSDYICLSNDTKSAGWLVEGWATYAEFIADEEGIFNEAEQKLAWLDYRLTRAMRIILDVKRMQPETNYCLLYTSPSPRDQRGSRMPSSA